MLRWSALLLPALLLLGLYVRALDYELVWMDQREIGDREIVLVDQPLIAAFDRPLHQSPGYATPGSNPYYRPLQIVAATAIHRVVGPTPRYYRLWSLFLGVALCTVFALFARDVLGSVPAALLAAALTAAHPVGVEAYAWISGVAEPLSALFVIASVWLGLRFVRSGGAAAAVVAALAAVLAWLAKEKGVVAPVLLVAATVGAALESAGAARRARLRRGLMLAGVQAAAAGLYVAVWRPAVLGATQPAHAWIGNAPTSHWASAIASWPQSLGWLFAPLHSNTSDAVRVVTSLADPMLWLGLALALFSLVAWVALLRAGRTAAALGLAWIWIAFLPSANLTPQLHARAERYLFLSVFGAALLVADLLPLALRALPARARSAGFAVLGAALVLVLAQRTWVRLPDWRSTEILFERDLARDPDFREGRYHLAKTYFLSQRYPQAAEHLARLTAAVTPGSPARASYVNEVGLHELSCNNALASGRPQDAVRRVTRLRTEAPAIADLPGIQSCLGMALEQQGRQQEALTTYLALLAQLEGEPPPGFSLSLARVYARLGRADEAREWLERARATGPREPAFDAQLRAVERMLR